MMIGPLLQKAISGEFLTADEGLKLWQHGTTAQLMLAADLVRYRLHPQKQVTWIIDRNVNYTNVCTSGCKFCNFYRGANHTEAYITTLEQYREKIDELFSKGGDQLLLQGGMHPELGLAFYTGLFRSLKSHYPTLKLHALGPAEIVHIARFENMSYTAVLQSLMEAGLDSLPGAGAEILCDRVRKLVSPNKCSAGEWLDVMRAAHALGLYTSATMMFGHLETIEERIHHLEDVRQVQSEKPVGMPGFISFIPWPFQRDNTSLSKRNPHIGQVSGNEYVRTIALARLMLPNIPNIQASWLTVGKEIAQICLYAGANDFGSIMIEENVVSVAGSDYHFDAEGIQKAIMEAGFQPVRRNQRFEAVGQVPA